MKTIPLTTEGKLSLCPSGGCNYHCCDFGFMAHIILYPGELDAARVAGMSTSHLEIVDDNYHGGQRAKCHATRCIDCDGGYKPLDCRSYPFVPIVTGGSQSGSSLQQLHLGKGTNCPLSLGQLSGHRENVRSWWLQLIDRQPEVLEWIALVSNGPTDPFDQESYELAGNDPH